ncbi:MAG: phospholipase D-like domain-containing protein [Candidatus Pacebacteria bacterium]|nr:phospholipase D-like domain-containing protein [Candidatus Paceibacterota bacterium]
MSKTGIIEKVFGNGTSWKFFLSGETAQNAMLEAIKGATKSIEIEQYIWSNDEIGIEFFKELIAKARGGVAIRLLCDHVGSFDFFSSEWPGKLRDAGAKVRFFNIVSPWRVSNFTAWYFRNHRKTMVIDNKVAFIGGVGIRKDIRKWRDTHLSITGDIVDAIKTNFDDIWNKSKRRNIFLLRKWFRRIKKFNLLTNVPHFFQRHIYHVLVDNIRSARHSILLTTPYFIPDGRLFRALRLAAKRGVEVKLIIPEKSDVMFFNIAAYSYIEPALKAGIRVFLFQNAILHAKTVVIDGKWATVGSLNLDTLSLLWNYEANIESTDKKFVDELAGHFETDLKTSREVIYSEWKNRPFFDKMLQYLSYPLHRFL